MLQAKLRQIGERLREITPNCTHYYRTGKFPAIVWAETGEEYSFNSDNKKSEQRIIGTVDLFTKAEFDTLIDDVQTALEDLGFTWSLESVQYEDETKVIHYEWTWGVTFYGTVEEQPGS